MAEQQGQFGQVPPENEKHSRLSVLVAEIETGIHCSNISMFWHRSVETTTKYTNMHKGRSESLLVTTICDLMHINPSGEPITHLP